MFAKQSIANPSQKLNVIENIYLYVNVYWLLLHLLTRFAIDKLDMKYMNESKKIVSTDYRMENVK